MLIRGEDLGSTWAAKSNSTIAQAHSGILYVSGLVAFDADGKIVGADMADQSKQVFGNLRQVLTDAGITFEQVFKINSYLSDLSQFRAFADVRGAAFPDRLPVNTTVGAALALPDLLVEVVAQAFYQSDDPGRSEG